MARQETGAAAGQGHFTGRTHAFLTDLGRHNDRDWFQANKDRYERDVREPARAFIRDLGAALQRFAPDFEGSDERVGGSLSRINRDTRFSKDKSPYKTGISMKFWHAAGRGADAPFYYVHVEPGWNFVAAGLRHAGSGAVGRVRQAIVDRPEAWQAVLDAGLGLEGERLKRPPAGFPKDHPFIEDLKRKDFVAASYFEDRVVASPDFLAETVGQAECMAPLVAFVTGALHLE